MLRLNVSSRNGIARTGPCVRPLASSTLSRLRRAFANPSAVASRSAGVPVTPIVLAADSGCALGFPKALAPLGGKTALDIALDNCAGLAPPIVVASPKLCRLLAGGNRAVLGCPVVVHRRGSRGQLGSLLAGLGLVPMESAFMVYAVDYPLLTAAVVRRLVKAFETRRAHQSIVLPRFRDRAGHPVIFAADLRRELARAESARAVIYRDPRRVKLIAVRDSSITEDFDTPAAYRRVLREYLRRLERR